MMQPASPNRDLFISAGGVLHPTFFCCLLVCPPCWTTPINKTHVPSNHAPGKGKGEGKTTVWMDGWMCDVYAQPVRQRMAERSGRDEWMALQRVVLCSRSFFVCLFFFSVASRFQSRKGKYAPTYILHIM